MSSLAENTMPESHTFGQSPKLDLVITNPYLPIRRNNGNLRKVHANVFDLSFDSIVSQIDEGIIKLLKLTEKPKYQRKYFWSDEKASQLVESILLNVPIPNCYFAEDTDYRYVVIDGQQRLYSVYRYMNDMFGLKGLKVLPELEGLKFSELPSGKQKDIQLQILSCVVITKDSHPDTRFEVFERLNAEATPLNPQEIRNCIFRGEFNDMLGELANEPIWLDIRNRPAPDGRMADEQIILRFFSFELQKRENYQPPFDKWLNNASQIGQKLNRKKLLSLKKIWFETINKSLIWFEPSECFRKPGDRQFNEILFDLTTYTARKMDADIIFKTKSKFKTRFNHLLKTPEFRELLNPKDDSRVDADCRIRLWNNEMSDLGL